MLGSPNEKPEAIASGFSLAPLIRLQPTTSRLAFMRCFLIEIREVGRRSRKEHSVVLRREFTMKRWDHLYAFGVHPAFFLN